MFKDQFPPNHTDDLVQRIRTKSFLILYGDNWEFDKERYVRHLAYCLTRLSTHSDRVIREWVSYSQENLFSALRREKLSGIYILDRLHPSRINWDWEKLNQWAIQNRNIVLITTEQNRDIWFPRDQQLPGFWYNTNKEITYCDSVLEHFLDQELTPFYKELFQGVDRDFKQWFLEEGLSNYAKGLGNPQRLAFFAYSLIRKAPINKSIVAEALEAAEKDEQSLIRNFNQLPEKDKLLVLGISLLDGLYEEQFFAAMAILSESRWGLKSPEIKALDYSDLRRVSVFIKDFNPDFQGAIIENKFPNQRAMIINRCWSEYRRQVIEALPILTKLIIDSVSNIYSDWELYGTSHKRAHLRTKLAETFSELGFISPETVEYSLMQLASHNDPTIQRVAAKAIASWRNAAHLNRFRIVRKAEISGIGQQSIRNVRTGKSGDELLFSTLQDWLTDRRFANLVRSIQLKADEVPRAQPLRFLKATIVLTLGEAAAFDHNDQLHPESIRLMLKLLSEKHRTVQSRLEWILPDIFKYHGYQLLDPEEIEEREPVSDRRKLIRLLFRSNNLIVPMAVGFAQAFAENTEKGERIIDYLVGKYEDNYQPMKEEESSFLGRFVSLFFTDKVDLGDLTTQEQEIKPLDRLAICIIFVCHKIVLSLGSDSLVYRPEGEVALGPIDILLDLRRKVQHPTVLELLFLVLVSLFDEDADFDLANKVIEPMKEAELQALKFALGQRFQFERQSFENGDEVLEVGGREFQIWIDDSAPLTNTEKLLYKWLVKGESTHVKLALLSFSYFEDVFYFYENERINQRNSEREEEEKELREQRLKAEKDKKRELKSEMIRSLKRNIVKSITRPGRIQRNELIVEETKILVDRGEIGHKHLPALVRILKNGNDETSKAAQKLQKQIKPDSENADF